MNTKIIFITSNKHKIAEINQILKIKNTIITDYLSEFNQMIQYEENAWSFEGNALKKIEHVNPLSNTYYMSEDSGLCVDALNGAPGIFSARYCGENSSSQLQCRSILQELSNSENRSAKFVCCLAIKAPNGETFIFRGEVLGRISRKMAGEKGFGYDPIFIPNGYDKTMAELNNKNLLSHRFNALTKFKKWFLEI
tara:strand:+ start:2107 stop:2691 length:585 start_codon:yes stop_codon:yes gene_type:complete